MESKLKDVGSHNFSSCLVFFLFDSLHKQTLIEIMDVIATSLKVLKSFLLIKKRVRRNELNGAKYGAQKSRDTIQL